MHTAAADKIKALQTDRATMGGIILRICSVADIIILTVVIVITIIMTIIAIIVITIIITIIIIHSSFGSRTRVARFSRSPQTASVVPLPLARDVRQRWRRPRA